MCSPLNGKQYGIFSLSRALVSEYQCNVNSRSKELPQTHAAMQKGAKRRDIISRWVHDQVKKLLYIHAHCVHVNFAHAHNGGHVRTYRAKICLLPSPLTSSHLLRNLFTSKFSHFKIFSLQKLFTSVSTHFQSLFSAATYKH